MGLPKLSTPRMVLGLLCIMYLLYFVNRVNISTAAPLMKSDLGLSNTQLDYQRSIEKDVETRIQTMLERIVASLGRFRVMFDSFVREVDLVPGIPAAIELLDSYEADGTVWARTSAHGDDKDRPLLRSADGSHLYFAADVAYIRDKLERADRAIYVLGVDHHGYGPRLTAAAAMLGYDPERVSGFAFGFGMERMAQIRFGVDHVKAFFDDDIRFLSQF